MENVPRYYAPRPIDQAFLVEPRKLAQTFVEAKNSWSPILDGVRYDVVNGGIHAYFKDMKEPKHGFPFPEAFTAIDEVKRISTLVTALPGGLRGLLERLLIHYNRITYHIMNNIVIEVNGEKMVYTAFFKDIFLTPAASEIKVFFTAFFVSLGVTEQTAEQTARVIAHLIEYDDTYRFRLQDLMSESSKETLLKSPRKEIARLLDIYLSREQHVSEDVAAIKNKIRKMVRLLSLILLVPRIKRAFKHALSSVRFERLQLDKADKYHCLMRADYNFCGKTTEERKQELLDLHGGKFPEVAVFAEQQ